MKHIHELALSGLADLLARRAWNELKDHEHDGEVADVDAHGVGEGGEVDHSGLPGDVGSLGAAGAHEVLGELLDLAPVSSAQGVALRGDVEEVDARARCCVCCCFIRPQGENAAHGFALGGRVAAVYELHGSSGLGFERSFFQRAPRRLKYTWVIELHLRRNAAGQPVLDALDASAGLVETQEFGYLGRATKSLDEVCVVIHRSI